ncbi:CLUMA_CG018434, isoform A [Clunio marinus]|uniref:CLUMA_CG018434, isoform A n=1 Tax=Clunio marinus TaxID=568069 RepID=A0A1J1J3R9_9DIPT|nr:CLUMA_CG018434, isoform A [Clunio marinus]
MTKKQRMFQSRLLSESTETMGNINKAKFIKYGADFSITTCDDFGLEHIIEYYSTHAELMSDWELTFV